MEFTDGHQDSPPIPIPASHFTGALDRLMENVRMREEIWQEVETERRAAVEAEVRRELPIQGTKKSIVEFTDGHQDSPLPASCFTGALDRFMERERMREEIRREMEMERRAVEAEVMRRELLIMEQYALQRGGLSLQSSQQHLMDFDFSPQPMRSRSTHFGARAVSGNMPLWLNRESRGTEPVSCGDPQKHKLVVLESKAVEEKKTATKRKAPSPPPQAAEEIDVPLVEIAKKTKENRFNCEVCRVSSNSELTLQDHLRGRKHKSKEAALSAKKKEAALSAKKEAAEENLRFPFWCRTCKVGAHTEDVMLRHELGKKHVNRRGKPESKLSVLVNDLAEWVDAHGKERKTDELVDKAEPEEDKVVEDQLEGI